MVGDTGMIFHWFGRLRIRLASFILGEDIEEMLLDFYEIGRASKEK